MENLPLEPQTVEGADPGSVYTVVARSLNGYIAVRRISKYFYRVRAERFDSQPLLDVNDAGMIATIVNAGMAIRHNGTRITGVTPNKFELTQLIAVLEAALFKREIDVLDTLPEGSDPMFLNEDAKIDAVQLKKALTAAGVEPSKDSIKN